MKPTPAEQEEEPSSSPSTAPGRGSTAEGTQRLTEVTTTKTTLRPEGKGPQDQSPLLLESKVLVRPTKRHNTRLGGWQHRAETGHTETFQSTSLNKQHVCGGVSLPHRYSLDAFYSGGGRLDRHLHVEKAAGLSQGSSAWECWTAPGTRSLEVPKQQQMATGCGGGGADFRSCPAFKDEKKNPISGNWYALKSCFNR